MKTVRTLLVITLILTATYVVSEKLLSPQPQIEILPIEAYGGEFNFDQEDWFCRTARAKAGSPPSADEYEIYGMLVGDFKGQVFPTNPLYLKNEVLSSICGVRRSFVLENRFDPPIEPVKLISQSQLQALMAQQGSADEVRTLELSPVGYSADGQRAACHFMILQDEVWSSGGTALLKRMNGRWEVKYWAPGPLY